MKKIIILLSMIILLCSLSYATIDSDLRDDLYLELSCEDDTTTDYTGNFGGITNTGVTITNDNAVWGERTCYYDGSSYQTLTGFEATNVCRTSSCSVFCWVKPYDTGARLFFGHYDYSLDTRSLGIGAYITEYKVLHSTIGTSGAESGTISVDVAKNQSVYFYNENSSGEQGLYVDGLFSWGAAAETYYDSNTEWRLGSATFPSGNYVGYLECGVWDRTLTTDERLWLEDINNNLFPNIVAIFEDPTPTDGDKDNIQQIINVSCVSGNVTLWLDNNTDPITKIMDKQISPASNTTTFTVSDTYYYKASCDNGDTNSTVRSYIYDIDSPLMFTDFVNDTLFLNRNVTGQFNFTDNILLHSLNISSNGIDIYNITHIHNTTYQVNLSFNPADLGIGFGVNNLTVRFADGHTAIKLIAEKEYNPTNGLFNDYIKYDFKKPYKDIELKMYEKEKSLFDDWSYTKTKDRFSEIYKPSKPSKIKTFVIESDSKIYVVNKPGYYGGYWLIVGEHWKDFVIKNDKTAYIKSIVRINDQKVEVTIDDITNIEEIQFMSTGDLNIVTEVFNYNYSLLYLNTVNIQPLIAFENDDINGYCNATEEQNSKIDYDYQWYINNIFIDNGTVLNQNSSVNILLNTLSSTETANGDNITFACRPKSKGVTLSYQNSTEAEIEEINIGFCNTDLNFNYSVYNITYLDEVSKQSIEVDVGLNLQTDNTIVTFNLNNITNNQSTTQICTNIKPDKREIIWNIWGDITLTKDSYATRLIQIQQAAPRIASNTEPLNETFYLLGLSNSSTFTVTWLTTEFQRISGTMLVYRCEGDGTRTLVESAPIVDSIATVNIELLNIPYSYEIIVGGVTYSDLTSFSSCHIESETSRTFYVDISGTDYSEFIGMTEIPCNFTKDGQVFLLQWGLNPESSSTITGCVTVQRQGGTGFVQTDVVCSTTETTGTIPTNSYNYLAQAKLYQGEYSVSCIPISDINFINTEGPSKQFGLEGIFAVFLLIAAMALLFAGDDEITLIAAIVALIVVFFIGITTFTWLQMSGMISLILVVGIVGRYIRK